MIMTNENTEVALQKQLLKIVQTYADTHGVTVESLSFDWSSEYSPVATHCVMRTRIKND